MTLPRRLRTQTGRFSLVDGIPFEMPIRSSKSPAFMAAFSIDAERARRLLPLLLMKPFGTGQYVVDLPVSTEISVKGGKGIWGMPKHQANLSFSISDTRVSSQDDLDGKRALHIDMRRPTGIGVPLRATGVNWG